MSGYVFGAFLLLFAGIYTTDINLNAGLTNFEYVLDYMGIIFLIIVPILTMRVVAEGGGSGRTSSSTPCP